jgi:predicted N-acetyltransferase YhbS
MFLHLTANRERLGMIAIEPESGGSTAAIERLLDQAFGPSRHRKTAQRLRDGQLPAAGLALVAKEHGAIVATLRFWEIIVGEKRAGTLLLGPLVVAPTHRSIGLGTRLVRHGLRTAKRRGYDSVLLIGDEPFYRRFGFTAAVTMAITLPGRIDRSRFLGLELERGALGGVSGLARAAGAPLALAG